MLRAFLPPLAFAALLSAQQPDPEKEAALGAQLAKHLREQMHVLDDPATEQYVKAVAETLNTQPFTLTVVSDDLGGSTHEPLALPGAYLFIPAALLDQTRDQTELAAMLAHSMAHVLARHSLRPAGAAPIINYGSIPLVFLGGWVSGDNAGMAVPLAFLKVQRKHELAADRDAVLLLHAAGYDPREFVRYLTRVQRDPRQPRQSGIPQLDVRIPNLEAAIKALP